MDIKWTHLRKVLSDYGTYFIDLARKYLGQNGSYASGTLGDTMTFEVKIDDERMAVGVEMEDYWQYVEYGRKPGKQPPVERIMEWIKVKPIKIKPYTYTPSIKSLAFLIQRSIKEDKGYAPPQSALQDWIEKKGIRPKPVTVTPSVRSLAYVIARKIGREGTSPAPFFERAKAETYAHFKEPIALAISEDMSEYLQEMFKKMAEPFGK